MIEENDSDEEVVAVEDQKLDFMSDSLASSLKSDNLNVKDAV